MIKITDRDYPDGTFYKAVSKQYFDQDIQDFREVFYGTLDNINFTVEVYQGPNYILVSSAKRSWSKQYKDNYPIKIRPIVEELKLVFDGHFNKNLLSV